MNYEKHTSYPQRAPSPTLFPSALMHNLKSEVFALFIMHVQSVATVNLRKNITNKQFNLECDIVKQKKAQSSQGV